MKKPFALIIEDDPQLNWIFSRTLQDYFITEAIYDGSAAFTRLAQVVPDVVLLDINLPGMNGADILHSIRQDERLQNTRVILCTADNHSANALQEKADIVMLKPVSPVQLRDIAVRFMPD